VASRRKGLDRVKHKCVVNGCGAKGIYNIGYAFGTYCKDHAPFLAARHGWRHGWQYDAKSGARWMAWYFIGLGGTHEGRHIGKSRRAWRFERCQKADPELIVREGPNDA
jgi:hypothetical protein